jgi:hypothetical protein
VQQGQALHKEATLIVRKANGKPVEYITIKLKKCWSRRCPPAAQRRRRPPDRERDAELRRSSSAVPEAGHQAGAPDGGTIDWAWNIAENVPA